MKKTYIAPELTIVKVETNRIICASEQVNVAEETASQANVTEADARRYSVWDDEEDW